MILIFNKSKNHAEKVEEGGYLASASDLMVGLLFVFIIMVVILSQRIEQAETSKNPKDPARDVYRTIGNAINDAGVPVHLNPQSGVITLPSDILFSSGSADLSKEGINTLSKANMALSNILPCYIYSRRSERYSCPPNPENIEIDTIFIEGHTDSAPLQKGNYTNWHLGLDRARSVYDRITENSMQEYKNERYLDVFAFSSYADKRPVDVDDPSKNRRVEIRFILAFKPENKEGNKFIQVEQSIQRKLKQ